MRQTNVAEDMAAAGAFESRVAELIKQLDETRHAAALTPDGEDRTPDQIAYEELVRDKMREGLESLIREPTVGREEAKRRALAAIARAAR
jgi:hypothetical protein